MKKNWITLCFLLFALPLVAQQEAKNILNRTADAFRKAGGICAEFTVKSGGTQLATGTISLKGEKFVLETEDAQTWFDGRTQWTYLAASDEVNISEPTAEELQSINPYAWLSLPEQGYALSQGSATASEAGLYKVVLTAQGSQEPQRVTLFIKKSTNLPSRISLKQRGGETVEILITSCQTGKKYPDSFFVFDKRNYPGVEIIDLR